MLRSVEEGTMRHFNDLVRLLRGTDDFIQLILKQLCNCIYSLLLDHIYKLFFLY